MSGYSDRLNSEIHERLDKLAEQGTPWIVRWITHEIVNSHNSGLPDGEDGEFFQWTAYTTVCEEVRKIINKRAGDKPSEPAQQGQVTLPGFDREYMQDYYLVKRDGESVGMPVTELTDEEIEAKAQLYRKMGAACYAHADELERFQHWRRSAA